MTDLRDPPDHDPRSTPPGDRDVDARALDADERALAGRIAAAAPQRGPSAELDARILAMARAPVAAAAPAQASDTDAAAQMADANAIATAGASSVSRTTPADVARGRRRRRWPAMAGIAATLTLTFGLAWQMRPQEAPLMESSEAMRAPTAKAPGARGPSADDAADSAMSAAPRTAPNSTPDDFAPAAVVSEPEQAAASAMVDGAAASPQRAKSAPAAASASGNVQGIAPAPPAPPAPISEAPAADSAPAAPSTATVFDDPSPMDTPAPAPAMAASPPPPPAPVAGRVVGESNAAPATSVQRREAKTELRRQSNAAAEADAAASTSRDARTELDRVEVTGTRIEGYGDQPLDDQPPASADTPAVREAWLARVRQLIADGRSDEARDSLREYRRRHPDAPIPDDLRPLLPAE